VREKEHIKFTYEDIKEKHEQAMEDCYLSSLQVYDSFEEASRKKGHGYSCPSFPIFNQRIEGLEEGLYIFAGESNSGKTALMTNLMWAFCKHKPNKLFGIYYSLDDSTNEVIPRLIAMNERIPISVGSKPTRYEDYIKANANSNDEAIIAQCTIYQDYLNKRAHGLEELKKSNKEFYILDRTRIRSFEQLIDHATKTQMFVKRFDPENNIIIAIDSLADIVPESKKFSTDRERIDYVTMKIKEVANVELKIPIFTSYHVRKLNHQGRPTLDDMKESSRIVYEASLAFLVFNDVSKNKQSASVYYSDESHGEKCPVIEMDWAKNKKSSYKGRTYHYFVPDYSNVRECGKDAMTRYDAIIYSK
jgi:replicative DNA helicase